MARHELYLRCSNATHARLVIQTAALLDKPPIWVERNLERLLARALARVADEPEKLAALLNEAARAGRERRARSPQRCAQPTAERRSRRPNRRVTRAP